MTQRRKKSAAAKKRAPAKKKGKKKEARKKAKRKARAKRTAKTAQEMAGHSSARTASLYNRVDDEISLDEVERILI